MNQDKLESVMQEMERLNDAVLGVCAQKWTEMGHFQKPLQSVLLLKGQTQRKQSDLITEAKHSTTRGYNARSDQIMSVRLLGKPGNTATIQVYVPTAEAEEDEIESFYASIQEEVNHTPKQDMLTNKDEWNTKVGNKAESLEILD